MSRNKCIMIFLFCMSFIYGAEYNLQLGLSPYRKTYIRENGNLEVASGDFGLSLGSEILWNHKALKYGAGFELKNEVQHGRDFFTNKDSSYYTHPVYGVIKYQLPKEFYILGRLGMVYNDGELVEKYGKYLGVGVGKSMGNLDFALLYEASELKNSGKISVIKDDLHHSGLFYDGALDEVSLKIAYTFGKGNKKSTPKVEEKATTKEETKPAVTDIIKEEIKLNKPVLIFDEKVYTNPKEIPALEVQGNEKLKNAEYSYRLEKLNPETKVINAIDKTFAENYNFPTNLEDGQYRMSVTVYKEDKVSETNFKEFEIDSKGPQISLSSSVEGNKAKWQWKLDESTAVVKEIKLDGIAVSPTENGFYDSVKELEAGKHTLSVKAYDKNGNESTAENSVTITKPENKSEKELIEDFSKGLSALPVIKGYKTNITKLTAEQKRLVSEAIKALEGQKGTLYVIGYTDDTGTEKINLKLSKQRADNVALLIKTLITNSKEIKMETMGRGETNFNVPNTSEENRKLNRRIELEFKEEK